MTERSAQLRKNTDKANKQNRSDAVMAQRGAAGDEPDDFPTPPWATRAFLQKVMPPFDAACETVLEPAANRGYMSEVLKESFTQVDSYDIADYGYCEVLPGGFLENERFSAPDQWDWVITNPPFTLTEEFVQRGLHVARRGVAMLCRTVIIEGQDRYRRLYSVTPPSLVAQYVERVPMVEGQFDPKASTATGYCWVLWDKLCPPTNTYPNQLLQAPMCWIPPSRKELERPWERINGLLLTASNEKQKATEIAMGIRNGTSVDVVATEKKSRERLDSARKEIAAIINTDLWHHVRPLLRDVDGGPLHDKAIEYVLTTSLKIN